MNTNGQPNLTKSGSGWKKALLILAPIVIVLGLIVAVLASAYIGANNKGVRFESSISAQYKDNQNILSRYTLSVKEALGVSKVYSAELDKVIRGSLEGRYGPEGNQADWAWIQEAYPGQFDAQLFKNVQQIVVSGRKDFEVGQTLLIDKIRVYENDLGYFWTGFWLKLAGFPKVPLDKYKPIISTDAKAAFDTGVDKGIEIK